MAWFMCTKSKEKQSYVIDFTKENIKSRRKKTPIATNSRGSSGWQGENKPTSKFSSHFSYLLSLVQEKLHTHVFHA